MGLPSTRTVPLSSHDKLKMDDRKRSLGAVDNDESTPPSKRQATLSNGAVTKMDADKEKEIEVGACSSLGVQHKKINQVEITVVPERCHITADAGIQARQGHFRVQGQ